MRQDNNKQGNRGGSNRRNDGGGSRFNSGGGYGGGHGGGNSGGFGGGFNRAPREMHKAVCAECNKECDVPFKPTEGKPVYCRDCFQKHKPKRF